MSLTCTAYHQSTFSPGLRPGGKFTSSQAIILYRKFSATKVFTGYEILAGDQVLITDQEGVVIDIVDKADAGNDVEQFEGILSPGLINCHCHLELSHLRSHIPKHTGLVDFVFKVVTERHFEDAEILQAIETAETEMLDNGIVAVGDICNTAFTITQKKNGRLHYHNFIETSGFPASVAETRFQRSLEFYNAFREFFNENSIVPHAPYSVSPELFHRINEMPGNHILSIHNQEIPDENYLFENKTGDFIRMFEKMGIDISFFEASGKTSLQTWLPQFTKGQSLILVHNVAISAVDIAFAQHRTSNSHNLHYCLCPNANLYISNKLPDVELLINKGCKIVMGTDSLASNDELSIVAELFNLQENLPGIELVTMLGWATINGAHALGIDHKFGSFEKGKKPGLILLDGNDKLLSKKIRRII